MSQTRRVARPHGRAWTGARVASAAGTSPGRDVVRASKSEFDKQRAVLDLVRESPIPLTLQQLAVLLGCHEKTVMLKVNCLIEEGSMERVGKGLYAATYL